ncbi:hypothetical protein [Micromonospora sp. NPDC049645]|uniref:hypothetical protein n=1 Tax=Micromonospora sp. NPDC049645 TaxID=3155508 RepID=UPI0034353042
MISIKRCLVAARVPWRARGVGVLGQEGEPERLGQSLVIALASYGIAVSAVAPRFTTTPKAKEYLDAPSGDAIRAQRPFGRVVDPGEITAVVLHCQSVSWSSGAVLDRHGAFYLRSRSAATF